MREVRILRALHHDNIIAMLGMFRRKNKLHLVFEYVPHTLLEVLERHPRGLPMPLVKLVLWQTLDAVSYLHAHKVWLDMWRHMW